jgi:hypothetical protein
MTQDTEGQPDRRVSDDEVAEIARLIAFAQNERNRRNRPLPGDLEGEFDQWFDGGAVQWVTGVTRYFFHNGATARTPIMPPFDTYVYFPDGRSVTIRGDGTRDD